MNKRLQIAAIISIIIALAVPIATVVKAQSDLKRFPIIKVKIAAYDPRDLLYGHYMTYRYDWNWKGGQADEGACYGDNCCLCAGEGSTDPEVELVYCPPKGEKLSCAHLIKGIYSGGNLFNTGKNRYYVDESVALPLERLFREGKETFRVGLGLSPNGKSVLEKLYVGDQTLEEYLATHDLTPSMPEHP